MNTLTPEGSALIDAMIKDAVEAGRQWRLIETAPKDGRDVLLYWPLPRLAKEYSRTKIGYWREKQGWVWQDRAVRSYSDDPTHWMPLPVPPGSAH